MRRILNAVTLENLLQDAYEKRVSGLMKKYQSRKVPDFREFHGTTLKKHQWVLTETDKEQTEAELAERYANRIAATMEAIIEEAEHPRPVMHFLKGFPLPNVLDLGDQLKIRHVFGVSIEHTPHRGGPKG